MFKFLLVLLGIYLLFSYVLPFLARLFLGRMLFKAHKAATKAQKEGRYTWQSQQQAPTTAPTKKQNKPLISNDKGEYVDYVEIK